MNPGAAEIFRQSGERAARKFRETFGLRTVPVDCFRLVRKISESGKINLKWFQVGGASEGFDAAAFFFPEEQLYLIYSRSLPPDWQRVSPRRRRNFTLAHELGHIFCGHLQTPFPLKTEETRAVEDAEADAFAAELLMPREVLGTFRSVQEAADALLVSESAVRRRTRDTGILFALRTCPACGYRRIPPAAGYCRKCGACLQEAPHPPEEPGVLFSPPVPEECPVCGYKSGSAPEGRCLNCDYPKQNHCLPEYDQQQHACPPGARFCETCGARTLYAELFTVLPEKPAERRPAAFPEDNPR